MALFGNPNAYIGIDIGTSSLKIVELINRKNRIEVATYAQANMPNPLVHAQGDEEESVQKVAKVISGMMDKANVSTDNVVAALPSTAVFSTVLTMPQISDDEMEKAVRFAARDVVPADLDEMELGWSRASEDPHMSTDAPLENKKEEAQGKILQAATSGKTSVFLTAAPKHIVRKYQKVMQLLQLKMIALEVETFSLIRSLVSGTHDRALIVDVGDLATTYHIIDDNTPQVSYTIDYGGNQVTSAIARALKISEEEAEKAKVLHGLRADGPQEQRVATELAVRSQAEKAKSLLRVYERQKNKQISKSIFIGGGANLLGLREYWKSNVGTETIIGNPWRGLSYPEGLEGRLQELGPTYGVAVGLALRGMSA